MRNGSRTVPGRFRSLFSPAVPVERKTVPEWFQTVPGAPKTVPDSSNRHTRGAVPGFPPFRWEPCRVTTSELPIKERSHGGESA